MRTLAKLKSFVVVLASQTKLYRVKQEREAHEVISTNGVFSEMICHPFYKFTENALPAACRVCCLSLIARRNSDI